MKVATKTVEEAKQILAKHNRIPSPELASRTVKQVLKCERNRGLPCLWNEPSLGDRASFVTKAWPFQRAGVAFAQAKDDTHTVHGMVSVSRRVGGEATGI